MDQSDEKMANKDDEPAPSPNPDVALPTTRADDVPPESPPAPLAGDEAPPEDLEKERERISSEESPAQDAEVESARSSLDSPARDQVACPSDSGERTSSVIQALVSPEDPQDLPLDPAEVATAAAAQVNLPSTSSSDSVHSLQITSPSDSGERTPTATQDYPGAEPSEDLPLESAEASAALVDLPDTSSSESTHSVPDSAVGLDSPMPPNSTAPSSTRTSLTDTPPVASSSSSSSSKPIGILRSATLPRSASSASMSAVTFAPLPPTEPRRRASHMQLGVAARSRMLRARRMRFVDPETGEAYIQVVDPALIEQQLQQGAPHYMYPGEEAAADGDPYRATRRQPRSPYATGNGGLWAQSQGAPVPDDEGNPEEDAFVALGKMVKGGAKALWRKVSKSQKVRDAGPADAAAVDEVEGADAEASKRRPGVRRSASAPAGLNGAHEEDEELPDGADDATLHIEFQEPRHCFEGATPAPPPLVPQSILRPATPLQAARAPAQEPPSPPRDGEVGRVWEEAIDTDLTKRFEAVARAERERERGKGRLVAKLVKVAKRRESREKLKQDRPL
ncbi:hypothetical protein PsYK624_125970 [Phanerochaete sordida]|uniref:Uncharacterized protein n=1 Tax=Phanerochaete sordida TaxID=48140 RepID=A0A9P3LIC4_9APHY|nr:hypothetical protein PsYK624_125970 [Phanerochaete sordida]